MYGAGTPGRSMTASWAAAPESQGMNPESLIDVTTIALVAEASLGH